MPRKSQAIDAAYTLDAESGCYVRPGAAEFAYSDGEDVENRLLEIIQGAGDLTSTSAELREKITDWPSLYYLGAGRSNLLRPLSHLLTGRVLEVGAGLGAVTRYLGELGGEVVALEGSKRRASGARARCRELSNVSVVVDSLEHFASRRKYDAVTLIGVLEYARTHFASDSGDPVEAMLMRARKLLKPGGVLILAIENQLGLKYFAGFNEDHAELPMFGIADLYAQDGPVTFGRSDLRQRLSRSGFERQDWLYPFPDYKHPTTVFSGLIAEAGEDLTPLLESSVLADPQFTRDQAFSLELAWGVVFRNGLVPDLANSFLIVASAGADLPRVFPAGIVGHHYSLNRRPSFASQTTFVKRSGSQPLQVTKTRLFPDVPQDEQIPLSNELQDETYIEGRNWQSELRRILNTPSWTLKDLQGWAGAWYTALLQHAGLDPSRKSLVPSAQLPGHLVDAIPRNLIVAPDGTGRFFDQEWRLQFQIEFGYLMFRSLFLELRDVTTVAEPAPDVPLHILPLFKRLAESFDCWITDTDFSRYIDFENDMQYWAVGSRGGLAASDLEGRYLLVRPPLFQHGLTERLQSLAVEVRTLREESVDREAALREFRDHLGDTDRAWQTTSNQLMIKRRMLEDLVALAEEKEREFADLLTRRQQAHEAKLQEYDEAVFTLRAQKEDIEKRRERLQAEADELARTLRAERERNARTEELQRKRHSLAMQTQQAENVQLVTALSTRLAQEEEISRVASAQVAEIMGSRGFQIIYLLWQLRVKIAPHGSRREALLKGPLRLVSLSIRAIRLIPQEGFGRVLKLSLARVASWIKGLWRRPMIKLAPPEERGQVAKIEPVADRRPVVLAHVQMVDIIVCVHNALEDVKRCLASVILQTSPPFRVIVVDDGSDADTSAYLRQVDEEHSQVELIRNEEAQGYTFAANKGLAASRAEYSVLLNSDTVVAPGWLDRLVACAQSDEKIGIVGPLSNTASWQSIPKIEDRGDWAMNPLPPGVSVPQMGHMLSSYSARLYPPMPLLNGFCLLLKRAMLEETGPFDEANFGKGYGEEDDLVLRARKLGWRMALADDAYVYHAQSRSYSSEKRKKLYERAGLALREKHGEEFIRSSVDYCLHSPVLNGIRARAAAMQERERLIQLGRRYADKRVLIVLPIIDPGGGGNVVVFESRALKKMGVEVEIFNEAVNREGFLRSYPDLPVPVRFGTPSMLPELCRRYDAVIATHNRTVSWLQPVGEALPDLTLGYYVQGFEPLMYDASMRAQYMQALSSYDLIPDLVRFTKTEWVRDEVLRHTGADSVVIGVDADIDLFRPRPNALRDRADRPLRIAAMIRPDSPYREPEMTMRLLKKAHETYGARVETVIFGTTLESPAFLELTHDFPWKLYGLLPSQNMASLLNSVDVFVDYSSHQAMGLTALEAMATGCAVILPEHGGAGTYLRHRENGMFADTTSFDAVWGTLRQLIDDDDLRRSIQKQAIHDVCDFPPERAALNILQALFGALPEEPLAPAKAEQAEPVEVAVVEEPAPVRATAVAPVAKPVEQPQPAVVAPQPEPPAKEFGEVCVVEEAEDPALELASPAQRQLPMEAVSDVRVLAGFAARSGVEAERQALIEAGREYAGRKVMFLLPVMFPGGGANIVNIESRAMLKMGVDVRIFNIPPYRDRFLQVFPDMSAPVVFDDLTNLTELCKPFDAVIATHYSSAFWLLSVRGISPHQSLGYYIQDFEPMMYAEGTDEHGEAVASYTLVPGLRRFTKTEWTRDRVMAATEADVTAVGVDFDLDLFRPRPRPPAPDADRPVRIAAMIRPESAYREPEKTMQLLKLAHKNFGERVETVIFGTEPDNLKFLKLTRDFPWKLYGSLPSRKVASLLNTADIFVDCSSHQAMGLTALEAMATGCAVIVPQVGGAVSFARHLENSLVADTSDLDAVWQSLVRLVVDRDLRRKLQMQAIADACDYFPERAALNILRCLFGQGDARSESAASSHTNAEE